MLEDIVFFPLVVVPHYTTSNIHAQKLPGKAGSLFINISGSVFSYLVVRVVAVASVARLVMATALMATA